ncbi:MAG: hypothetical protein KDK55_01780 [Chlamydiia bacterium]|nr:hypothetical protein [Chlamydiia bacterium]
MRSSGGLFICSEEDHVQMAEQAWSEKGLSMGKIRAICSQESPPTSESSTSVVLTINS